MGGIEDILDAVGLSPDIVEAVLRAEADPTSERVRAVVGAYAGHGLVPPPKLLAHLTARNWELYPEDRFILDTAGAALPWLVLGAAAWFVFKRR